MRRHLGSTLSRLLRVAGYELRRADTPEAFSFSRKQFDVACALEVNGLAAVLSEAKAKDGQDLLAAHLVDGPGFFVDVGAFDGVHKSNTWMLEKALGWTGILVEPHPTYFGRLQGARSAKFDNRVVSSSTGRKVQLVLDGESTRLASGAAVAQGSIIVETVSLDQLLTEHDAPKHIDYLSVDVEGHELQVLSGFPFMERSIGLVTAEHNFNTDSRAAVRELLESHGYVRVLSHLSRNEDWFVCSSLLARIESS